MTIKLLTKLHLEFINLKECCISSSESTLAKMPHCRKSHVTAQLFYCIYSHGVAMIRSALLKANLVGKVVEVALAVLVDMAVLKYISKGKIRNIMVLLT